MPSVRQYHLYHTNLPFARPHQESLQAVFDRDTLHPLLENSLKSNFNLSDDELPDEEILLLSTFCGSLFAKNFLLVPIPYLPSPKEESTAAHQERMNDAGLMSLQHFLGNAFDPEKVKRVAAFAWYVPDSDVFDIKEDLAPKRVSRFLRGNESLSRQTPFQGNNLQYWVDGKGVGVVAQQVDRYLIKQWLLMLALSKGYLMAFEEINQQVNAVGEAANQPTGLEDAEAQSELFNRFLLSYYFDSPISYSNPLAYAGYQNLKKILYIQEQYAETVEQLRLLGEINNAKRHRMEQESQRRQWQEQRSISQAIQHNQRQNLMIGGALIVLMLFILITQ